MSGPADDEDLLSKNLANGHLAQLLEGGLGPRIEDLTPLTHNGVALLPFVVAVHFAVGRGLVIDFAETSYDHIG